MKTSVLKLSITDNIEERITTLLQSGISLESSTEISLGVFLNNLPGFDTEYLSDRVQTIFLDGNAIDDLEKKFSNPKHVVALSAAMPGLAGAIFRKNSLCAALRTQKSEDDLVSASPEKVIVHLKLFNAIAQEKGMLLLRHGGIFTGQSLFDFFKQRTSLISGIRELSIDGEAVEADNFTASLRNSSEYFVQIGSDKYKM